MWLICVIIGVAIGFVVVSIMKGQLKSVRPNSGAAEYIAADSFSLNLSQDIFLYANTTRVPRNTNNKK